MYCFMEHCGWYAIFKPDLHLFLFHCRRILGGFNNRCIFMNRDTIFFPHELRERLPLEAKSRQKKIWFTCECRIKRKRKRKHFESYHQTSNHWDTSSFIIKKTLIKYGWHKCFKIMYKLTMWYCASFNRVLQGCGILQFYHWLLDRCRK